MKDPSYAADLSEDLASRLHFNDNTSAAFASSSRSTPSARQPAASAMAAELDIVRSSARSLAKLRDLPAASMLLLYTPVMVPPGFSTYDMHDETKSSEVASARVPTDPFETLGLALSKHHRRVRHVPYVPSVGFTETHKVFALQADGIIVVTCEPEERLGSSIGGHGSPSLEALLSKQADFAENVAGALDDAGRRVPMVNFHFGDDQWRHDVTEYKNVWVGEKYTAEAVTQIVQLLFKSAK